MWYKPIIIGSSRRLEFEWCFALFAGLLACLLRSAGLADFFTVDEASFWISRVHTFGAAIAAGNWAGTALTEHPGVTSLWLGLAGDRLAVLLGAGSYRALYPEVGYLALLRLPIALVNGAVIGLGHLALIRLLQPDTARLATMLWVCSPFAIGFGRLLHVDGLSASFATLTILLLLVGGRSALIASGVCMGLALLSKLSTLVLLPWAAALLLAQLMIARAHTPNNRWAPALIAGIGRILLWLAIAALTCLVLWPALWVEARATIATSLSDTFSNGVAPHVTGNYFLGQPVADPGPGFYPLVIVLRSTPLLLAGLLALPLALRQSALERPTLLALLSWVVLFTVALTVAAKKFDRYLLPTWPALMFLGAAGLAAVGRWIQARVRRPAFLQISMVLAIAGLLTVDVVAHPNPISYYNPLLGGGATAERLILVGWGEGMEEVGAWLSARPDINRGAVLSLIGPTLSPFLPREVPVFTISPQSLSRDNPQANYAVLYVRGRQRREEGASADLIARTPSLYTLSRDGITYATVHQLPRPFSTPVGAMFGQGLFLTGFSLSQQADLLTLTPAWDVRHHQPGGIFVFVHIIDPDGRIVAQVDSPIDEGMFALWESGQQFGTPLPLHLPAGLPPGEYRITLGTYHPDTGRRLSLASGAMPVEIDGPDALLLTTIPLPAP